MIYRCWSCRKIKMNAKNAGEIVIKNKENEKSVKICEKCVALVEEMYQNQLHERMVIDEKKPI